MKQSIPIRETIGDVGPSTAWNFLPFQNVFIYSCFYSLDFFFESFQNTEI